LGVVLTRYWFSTDGGLGFGVTAYSLEDAEALLAAAGYVAPRDYHPSAVVENIDIRTLDQNHVIPNMGPPSSRGVWYPCHNI
jgi:hypothetical protein